MSSRSDNTPAYFAKADAITVALAMPRNGQGITIFQPFTGLAARKLQRICAAPRQLQHAATRLLSRSTDRAACQQISRLKIAPVDRVMGKLLRNAPVKILEICARD